MKQQLLANQVIVVFGIRNEWSIGWGIAQSLWSYGAHLVLSCENSKTAEKVKHLVSGLGPFPVYNCDVTDDNSITQLMQEIKEKYGMIHGLVYSIAKGFDLDKTLSETSRTSFAATQEISVYSLIALTRAFVPLMKMGGSIVAITYIGSQRAVPNYNVMGIAKAGLEASIRYLALEFGESNIRVNGISAGPIKTTSSKGTKNINELLGIVKSKSPLRRNTELAEIGDVAVFLLSPLARGITGDVIYVDSGYHIVAD